jgi:hypothetical protein
VTNDEANVLIHQLGQDFFLIRLSVLALSPDLPLDQLSTKKNYDNLSESIERATHSLQALAAHLSTN